MSTAIKEGDLVKVGKSEYVVDAITKYSHAWRQFDGTCLHCGKARPPFTLTSREPCKPPDIKLANVKAAPAEVVEFAAPAVATAGVMQPAAA